MSTPGPAAPEGTRPSPNIWHHTETYEVENRAFDPDGLVEAAIASVLGGSWAGLDVLDLGCGTGFHLPRFAATAACVTGVEPHADLRAIAARRTRRLPHVGVLEGTAQSVPLPDDSVDLVHSRWAYFFGPGCEPGLAEVDRLLRPGGVHVVVDNDASRSTFGSWFARGFPEVASPAEKRAFWASVGYQRVPVLTRWSFGSREDLEAVVAIELPTPLAREVLADLPVGTLDVDYAVDLWWRRT
jgi:SAM-dependent methyltransferase